MAGFTLPSTRQHAQLQSHSRDLNCSDPNCFCEPHVPGCYRSIHWRLCALKIVIDICCCWSKDHDS
jgi:hypothetical protein